MSGRPQGRVRQSRRDRPQRNRNRDNSSDSVSSVRSERETPRDRNGRTATRRRPERRDERPRKLDDKPRELLDRDSGRAGSGEKREDKHRRLEKPAQRERNDPRDRDSRELNRDSHGVAKAANSLDRHGNIPDESRLSNMIKRISRETDRERRLAAARQLEEFFNNSENYQVIMKNGESVLIDLEDILYERGLLDIKEPLIQCFGVFGGLLGYDSRRYLQWIFNKLDSSASEEIKVILLGALTKTIQIEGGQGESGQHYFREFVVNIMSSLQNFLENVDCPELLCAVLAVIMPIAKDFPQAFAGHFRDTVDILVGWHIDTSQQDSLTQYTSDCLVQLHPYWALDIAFSLTLLGQFLEDMEAYAEELRLVPHNKTSPRQGLPSPYTSLPKLTALVRVFTTVVDGIGIYFSPSKSPSITPQYLADIIQRVVHCINMSAYGFYYEKLFVAANKCLASMCNWLQMHYACCSDLTASFVIQQLTNCPNVSYGHILSILLLLDKIINKVGTSMTETFIKQILDPNSAIMKLRLCADEAILSDVMKVYQGFLSIHDVLLMETAYKIVVPEMIDTFSKIKKSSESYTAQEADTLAVGSDATTATPDEPEAKPPLHVIRDSIHHTATILIFDLCALAEIATSKSAILGLWKLSPTLFELLTEQLSACEWQVAACFPAIQYTILHALYTHSQRNGHFLSVVGDLSEETSESSKTILTLLAKVLGNSSSSVDARQLCLVWLADMLDTASKTSGVVLQKLQMDFNFNTLTKSMLPLTFHPSVPLSVEVCHCLKMMIELRLMSRNCIKRCLQDSVVRLMDVCEEVRETYLSLIKIIPTDILTSFASRNLLQDRVLVQKANGFGEFKKLTTSCEDIWWTRKSHVIKPPSGTFHSYNFQVIMAFIQLGVLPRKDIQKDWLVKLFHSCNRNHKYSDSELSHFNRCESVLWFWATWEAAQFCILSRLRTPLGRAQETFQAIEGTLHQYAREARAADLDEQFKPQPGDDNSQGEEETESKGQGPKPFSSQLRACLLLQFVEALEKLMYNAHDGCTVGLPSPPKSVRVFFRTNRNTCLEWLTRIRQPAMEVAIRCGLPAVAVWHGMQVIQDMKTSGKAKGPEFENTILLLSKALCEVKSPQALTGIQSLCANVADHKLPWLDGTVLKAKGWYEQAAGEYKAAIENALPNHDTEAPSEDGTSRNNNSTCSRMATEFAVNEVVDCYSKLADWDEVERWQKYISNSRKCVQDGTIKQALRLHADLNYIRALSKFEDKDFPAVQNHLQLIPSTCLNSFTDSLKKSAWTLVPQETEMAFRPLWDMNKTVEAAELCLVQAGVMFSVATGKDQDSFKDAKILQAVKECIHQGALLAQGAVRVGSLDWPPLVSPPHILQLQCTAAADEAIQALTQGDPFPSLLHGDGTFTADPTRHDCATLNQALRFASHLAHLSSAHGKAKVSANEELSILELQTAKLARKHENYGLAQRLLLKQLHKLGIVVQPDVELNGQNNLLGSLVRGLTSVSAAKTASRQHLLMVQRESAKLAYAIGHFHDAIGILSGSVLEFTEVRETDTAVSELNSRSLVTLSKWLLSDRKLLTSATKTTSNVTPLVAKISSLCDTEEEFLGYGQSTLIKAAEETGLGETIVHGELVWNAGVTSVGEGVDDMESVCGKLLHLGSMQAPTLDKAWFNLAAWCYRWGRKTVEQASTMGNVELLLEERDRAMQNIPKDATDEQVEAVMLELGQAHSTASLAHEEDIGDDDQFYNNGMDATRKQLLQVCPSLLDANPNCLDVLLSVWKGVRDRLFKHYHYAAKAYFMYLKIGSQTTTNGCPSDVPQKINKSSDDGNVTATLRLLRLLVKHAGELRTVLEEGLAHTPTRPWKDIIPQLFSRLNHPETYVRQSVSDLLCRIAMDAPHLIVYPAVVGSATSMPQFLNKKIKTEGILPLLVKDDDERPSSQPDIPLADTTDKPEADNSMGACYRTIVSSLQSLNPKLVTELQGFIQELRRITLLWEELWLGSLIQTHQDVVRRQQQLDEEIKRVNSNVNLTDGQRAALIREKHVAIMRPIVFALEQLQKITNQQACTPHEQWFHRAYSALIEKALASLTNPANPSDARSSWDPFKQLLQTLQGRSMKKSAYSLVMEDISPTLAKMKSTAIYMPGQSHFEGEIVSISAVVNEVNILPTKTKPKKLVFVGSDGQRHTYLFKGLEDLHLDERIMQFLSICNNMFTRADSHRCPLFCARHYSVTPLGPRSGLIQWVDGAVPVFALYKRWQQREAATNALLKSAQGSNQPPPPPMKPSELFYSKMTPALKEKGIVDPKESGRKEWPIAVMRQVLEELIAETPSDLLSRELWCSSTGALEWWHMTKTYARSTAVMSMIGYIIGLGDRHLDNMLIDFTTGEVVHIDYNVCFEKGRGLRVPEKVPFRMTPNLEMALGVTGVEGMFRLSCEQVLKILKQGRETLLTLLEAFVYDPLVDWTTANDSAFASAFYGGGAPSMTDSKENKKEMERGVTQSLFSSRVAEMKVSWTVNRDDMLNGLHNLLEHLEVYTGAVRHLKSMDLTLEQLKAQQEMLQHAVSNTNHPLHSLQAKFDEQIKRQADHDKVLRSIKEKLNECRNWQMEHKVSFEMIRSSKLSILVTEILKPLDVGVPCFSPAIKFLKGAGQGNIISQCEQLETELSGLLQQRRVLLRNCLDLIHTYATVTSQFPADHLQHNRTFEWMRWLNQLVENSSTKTCSLVLVQAEETRSRPAKSDDPLPLSSVTALMSMEVKLQSNLTEQNGKLIKFCERRKQESVETGFLSKAVMEAYSNLKKCITDNHDSAVFCLASVITTALCSLSKRCLIMENTARVAGDRLSDLTSRDGDWFLEELCSMSGNVTQLLSLLRDHPVETEPDKQLLVYKMADAMKAVVAVHKVFVALQELMTNFRSIIVPEAIKGLLLEEPSVLQMVENLQNLVSREDVKLLGEALDSELKGKGTGNPQGFDESVSQLQQQFDSILQNGGSNGDESSKMTAGQMLLTGFNGLFTKVESELTVMAAAMSKINSATGDLTCDVIQDACKLQNESSSEMDHVCSKLFFVKRLVVMTSFFSASKCLAENLKARESRISNPSKNVSTPEIPMGVSADAASVADNPLSETPYVWDAEKCFSEDDLAVNIRHFIADTVQRRILGIPSHALGAVVLTYAQVLGTGDELSEQGDTIALENACKKIVDANIKKGLFKHKQLSHVGSLTSAYDVAWRKHDFARRLDNNVNLYKGVVQRAQLQLARFQWLYEEDLLRCPMRGNNMISPARGAIMADMRKRVQALAQIEPAVKAVEDKIIAQQSSIEQRLKWAAGANPGLNSVLKDFEKTVSDRKQLLQTETKYSSDVCSLSNALIHFELLRGHSSEAISLDNTLTALVKMCQESSAQLEKSFSILKTVSNVTSLMQITCPPDAPITLEWMKSMLESVGKDISSHKSRKSQAVNNVAGKRDVLKSFTNNLRAVIVSHQQLVGDVKALLTTMAKDEEAEESKAAKVFISTYNRLSEECAQLIKSVHNVCSGKLDGSDVKNDRNGGFEDCVTELRVMTESMVILIQWVHDHLVSLASPLMSEDQSSNGGKTPIPAPPPTFASALRQGGGSSAVSIGNSLKSLPESSMSPHHHPTILQREYGHSPANGAASPSTRPSTASAASPRKTSVSLARDPKTGKAVQQRNTYAISVWRRVKAKLEGRDLDPTKRMSVTDQVDLVIRESTSLDNLCQMYEGWTAWV
ncbi:serine/threonine-protein kinase SMG1 [Nematostella vectensis]|uniref:serine/threonine-protein kinase SMG1 n=1 Tax=Nematostella vectensis TaxID=45351 RepID=UPI002076D938|nr:serine/threonine-protein kinase SMG1 [Nematostella vectensis]